MQSRRLSLIKSFTNVAVGLLVAYATQVVVFPLFGLYATTGQHITITVIFTLVSLVRSYLIRRVFCRISERSKMTKTYTIELSEEKAKAVADALEFYSRICIGQFEEILWKVNTGVIPEYSSQEPPKRTFDFQRSELVEDACNKLKAVLNYPRNASYGIRNQQVHSSAKHSWEVKKVIDKAIALSNNPNPEVLTVNYDGLIFRVCEDQEPICYIKEK